MIDAAMDNKGKLAEQSALNWLKKQNLSLLHSNYSCRFGEIDLIMLDKDTLVFVEVRLRSHRNYGGAASSVDLKKQQKIITTANHFLMCHSKYSLYRCRFDVIAFESNTATGNPIWYKDAFRL
jgi:putative endonuclease